MYLYPLPITNQAFHINCIPPGARFNNICIMCMSHPLDPLPSTERSTLKLRQNASSTFYDEMVLPEEFPAADKPEVNHVPIINK